MAKERRMLSCEWEVWGADEVRLAEKELQPRQRAATTGDHFDSFPSTAFLNYSQPAFQRS